MSLQPTPDDAAGFGRLERRNTGAPMSDINMTPLIDVMLVLLVIFIITAPLLVSSVRVNLPKAEATSAASAAKFLLVSIAADGTLSVNDVPQNSDGLVQSLERAARDDPDMELRLRADTAVPYGRVVELMGLAHKAGLSHIGFVAERPQAAPQAAQ